jgi:predicted RNase H-like HicB family nuclease
MLSFAPLRLCAMPNLLNPAKRRSAVLLKPLKMVIFKKVVHFIVGYRGGLIRRGKDFVMQTKPYFIRAEWDDEARVWVATSDDVPGLATEAETMEGLIEKLKTMVPDLLEANGQIIDYEVPFEIMTRRFETAQRMTA